ncbi:hypothetical protein QJS10_CPA01g01553 [Acorus calamus]|uniref:Uncharacterized protein n=1 Tax=Acorus calamus TaxID=4465 RepID=A0AAV9FL96_ACOCL|nr:hypothetical protein QJS10_CPA01g01553 [Acorus calamus]
MVREGDTLTDPSKTKGQFTLIKVRVVRMVRARDSLMDSPSNPGLEQGEEKPKERIEKVQRGQKREWKGGGGADPGIWSRGVEEVSGPEWPPEGGRKGR